MSVYGLRTFDANGNILIDVDEKINRVGYITTASAGASSSQEVATLAGLLTVELSFPINSSGTYPALSIAHEVARSLNTIIWTDPALGTNIDSLIVVFIYV
jgi:hypothetical protein